MITGKPRRAISKWPRIYSFFWFPHLPVLFFTLSPLSSTTLFFHLVFFSVLSTSSSQSSSPPSFSSLCFYRCRMFPQISPHSLAVISFLSHVFFSSLLALASFFPPILISFFVPSHPSSLSSPSSCFPHFETSALTAGCQTTRRSYPQFTSSHNEDAGRSRCRVQTLKAAIRRSLWVSFGEEVKVGVWCLMLETAECFPLM